MYSTQKRILTYLLTLLVGMSTMIATTGCNAQNEAVALLNAAGPAVSSVVVAISPANAALGAKIKTDFAAAAQAVASFKKGTPCQDVEQALNLLLSDLNLIPQLSQYSLLIGVAVAAVESVLAVIPACQTMASGGKAAAKHPMTAEQFKMRWNAELTAHPELKVQKLN